MGPETACKSRDVATAKLRMFKIAGMSSPFSSDTFHAMPRLPPSFRGVKASTITRYGNYSFSRLDSNEGTKASYIP